MLRAFREGNPIMKFLMAAVVVIIAVAFAIESPGSGDAAADECVVEVEGSCVSLKDYHSLMRLVSPRGASNKEIRKKGYGRYAVQALVERELLLQEARRLGVGISDEKLDDELALGRVHYSWPVDAPLHQALAYGQPGPTTGATAMVTYIPVNNSQTKQFDFAIYKRNVRSVLRMSPKEFKARQHDEVVAQRVRQLIMSPVQVTENEAFQSWERDQSTATARYVEASNGWFERVGADLSASSVDAYAAKNKAAIDEAWEVQKDRWTAGCRLVGEILLRFPPGADSNQRLEQNELAKQAQTWLRQGVNFEVVARTLSEGRSASTGGYLGCLTDSYGAVADDLLKVAAELKDGQVSKTVETALGFHIVKNLGKLGEADTETLGRASIARNLAAKAYSKELAQSFGAKLIAAVQSGTSLSDAAKTVAAQSVALDAGKFQAAAVKALTERSNAPRFDISRTFRRTGSPIAGAKKAQLGRSLFGLKKADSLLEQVVETSSGVAVLQLKELELATKEKFAEEKDKILTALQQYKRADVLSRYVARLRARATKILIHPEFSGEQKSDSETKQKKSMGSHSTG